MIKSVAKEIKEILTMSDVYKNYLFDLGFLMKEYALEAKKRADAEYNDYNAGYLCGFHRIISLMQQQAVGFNISNEEIGLDGIDANEDLV